MDDFKHAIEERILNVIDEGIKVLRPDAILEILLKFHEILEEANK